MIICLFPTEIWGSMQVFDEEQVNNRGNEQFSSADGHKRLELGVEVQRNHTRYRRMRRTSVWPPYLSSIEHFTMSSGRPTFI